MKKWKKPMILTLSAEELSKHIEVAARSLGHCAELDFR